MNYTGRMCVLGVLFLWACILMWVLFAGPCHAGTFGYSSVGAFTSTIDQLADTTKDKMEGPRFTCPVTCTVDSITWYIDFAIAAHTSPSFNLRTGIYKWYGGTTAKVFLDSTNTLSFTILSAADGWYGFVPSKTDTLYADSLYVFPLRGQVTGTPGLTNLNIKWASSTGDTVASQLPFAYTSAWPAPWNPTTYTGNFTASVYITYTEISAGRNLGQVIPIK